MKLGKIRFAAVIAVAAMGALSLGIVLGVTSFNRTVNASVQVEVQGVEDALGIYHDAALSNPVSTLDFGAAVIDVFGNIGDAVVAEVHVVNETNSDVHFHLEDDLANGDILHGQLVDANLDSLAPGANAPGGLLLTELFLAAGDSVSGFIALELDASSSAATHNFTVTFVVSEWVDPITAHNELSTFEAYTGDLTEIDFEDLTHGGSSCDGDFDNPLTQQGVTFSDSTCLRTAFDGPNNNNSLFLSVTNGLIELPAGTPGVILAVSGIGDQEFWLKSTDGSGAFITQPQTAVSNTIVYLGFTSGYGIETVEVFSLDSGGLLAVYALLFEAP